MYSGVQIVEADDMYEKISSGDYLLNIELDGIEFDLEQYSLDFREELDCIFNKLPKAVNRALKREAKRRKKYRL